MHVHTLYKYSKLIYILQYFNTSITFTEVRYNCLADTSQNEIGFGHKQNDQKILVLS